MPPLRLVFLGPPGTGKGTQAQRLADSRGLAALSSGNVLRNEIRQQSDIGKAAQGFVQSGGLVPDAVICGVMLAAVDRLAPSAGFVLDGFPRTVPQAEALAGGLAARQMRLDAVLDFRCPESEIVGRIVGRRVCSNCQTTYNTSFLPPRVADRCDRCGGALVQRVDDREDVVRARLRTYAEQTAPLVNFYDRLGLLRPIDAAADAAAVEAEVNGVLSTLRRSG